MSIRNVAEELVSLAGRRVLAAKDHELNIAIITGFEPVYSETADIRKMSQKLYDKFKKTSQKSLVKYQKTSHTIVDEIY